ncbi:hypothetical protein [Nonomuraea angiospora]|uniref:hypothetical protein n=1 Tax=Nonomuraea angiospora TaxID=46172 RepID=UPI0029A77164|nr:hypothetical protein [Nonomuraea angiospora]MDX3107434.1 hypothetical protein [Nonomuraea angiospora]
MELEFVSDPGWAPTDVSRAPGVVFRFADVRITEWHEDQESHDCVAAHLDAPPGQVELFDWDGSDLFTLVTFTLRVAFHTQRVEVTVHPK